MGSAEAKLSYIPKEIESAAEQIPAVSPVLGKINRMTREMDTSPRELVKVIMLDPSLTGNVLKLVNSSFYGLAQRVKSLAQAVVLLGMNTVKNLAVSTALLSTVFIHEKRSPLNPESFWRHCLATAVGCRALAKNLHMPPEDMEFYFIAGLLHDVGKILLIRLDPSRYTQALSESRQLGIALSFAEQAYFGCTHAQAGVVLAGKWRLDPSLVDAIARHHDCMLPAADTMTALVTIANNLSKKSGAGESGNCVIEELAEDSAQRLNISPEVLNDTALRLSGELEKATEFLGFIQEH